MPEQHLLIFRQCLVAWDTDARYGLTPFCGNFGDYEDVCIPVQDIDHTNTVVGIGTVMWIFKADI